jgi:hypothetical protein
MQMGLGLPVRDVVAGAACDQLRTALVAKRRAGTSETSLPELTYGELCELGARSSSNSGRQPQFLWLWRNSIKDYDRLSRTLQKWSARMLRWTIQYRRRWAGSDWNGGLKAYDALTEKRLGDIKQYPSFYEFAELCDLLRAELEASQRGGVE